jgi:hypothetical protein
MRNRRSLLICGSVLTMVGILLVFLPESLALIWHIQHGRNANIGKYAIPVPILWVAREDQGTRDLIVVGMAGRFRGAYLRNSEWGMMDFSMASKAVAAEPAKAVALISKGRGTQGTVIGTFHAGDQQTVCIERTRSSFSDQTEINCSPASDNVGLSATYIGSAKSVDVFFHTLEGIAVIGPR